MMATRVEVLLEFIRLLVIAMANASLYMPEHRQVLRLCTQAHAKLPEAMGGGRQAELSLLLIDKQLVFEGSPLKGGMYTNRFIQALDVRGIGNFRILCGVTCQEIHQLVTCLSGKRAKIHSTDHIRFGRVEIARPHAEEGGEEVRRMLALSELPEEELARLMEIYDAVKRRRRAPIGGIAEIVNRFVRALTANSDPLLTLTPLRDLDEYTYTHSTNVCILNLAQAISLGIQGPPLHDIGIAAMLHDIGKLFIPEEVLTKPGKLEENEWRMIQQHPMRGAQYLLASPGVPHLAVVVAFEHHMKYDGSGYPHVPKNWRQNTCSYMTAISDCFDALRTHRPYRGSLELQKISSLLSADAGSALHPLLTRNFLRIIHRLSPSDEEKSSHRGLN